MKYIVVGALLGTPLGILFGNITFGNPIFPFFEGIVMGISIGLTVGVIRESKK